jgi:phytoene synthase
MSAATLPTHARYSQMVTQQSKSNFYYSFLLLPRLKREAIWTVYAFCRFVDNIVDEKLTASQGAEELLKRWRQELDDCYEGRATHPITMELAEHVQRFKIPKIYFEGLIKGVEMDLSIRRYATFTELYQYCYHVAALVGLMCIEIFGYRNPQTREYAVHLGVALQLTNVLRDLRADAEKGRIYLPQEDLQRFGYTEEELFAGVINPAFVTLMAFECERTRAYFSKAATLLPREDRAALFAAEIMGAIYYEIFRRIEHNPAAVLTGKVSLPDYEKIIIAMSIWLCGRLGLWQGLTRAELAL